MTGAATGLKFNRDFEIPLASIDTIYSRFITEWYRLGYDSTFPNILFDRHKTLIDKGLHTAYTYFLLQHAKPLEFKDYTEKNKKLYNKFLQWLEKNPLDITEKNRFSRFYY
jgi:hypothetical protein